MGLISTILGAKKVQFIQNDNTVIQFDASLKETHNRESPPTEFPVENGLTISDHVIVKPFELELNGIISDSPIGGIKGLLTEAATTAASALLPPIGVIGASVGYALFNAITQSESPSVAAYNQLLNLQKNAQPVTVLTSLYRYENMWIKSISVPRDASQGQALIFTVKMTQLILVSPQSVNVKIFANPGLSAGLQDLGQQSTDPVLSRFKQGVQRVDKVVDQLKNVRGF